ncbi:MAG: hypothetical protein ACR2JF_15795 [Iamia sp.]
MAAVVLFGLGLVSCGTDSPADGAPNDPSYGPLAVVPGPPNGQEALLPARLEVTDDCVTAVLADGREWLLAWPQDSTSWDDENQTVTYSDGRTTVELRHGDSFSFGGGGTSVAEGGSERIASIGWVAEPAEACPDETIWSVGSIADP